MSEKRIRDRIPYEVELIWVTNDKEYHPVCHDISMGGVYFLSDDSFNMGTKGTLRLTLKFGTQKINIDADCEVTRKVKNPKEGSELYGTGLKIIKIDTESSIQLFNIIQYQSG